jgi:hypothetical protein
MRRILFVDTDLKEAGIPVKIWIGYRKNTNLKRYITETDLPTYSVPKANTNHEHLSN